MSVLVREERNAKIGLIVYIALTVKCLWFMQPRADGIYFLSTKPISHDVIPTVLDTLRQSVDVTFRTKNYELQGQLMTFSSEPVVC